MSGVLEFSAWPKTPRWYRDIVITEKIDGTNGAVCIERFPYGEFSGTSVPDQATLVPGVERDSYGDLMWEYLVVAQSRKRVVTPSTDNAGFARWVWNRAGSLVDDLGPGRHFGEWWGQGIQRNYGLDHKRFSLFNTAKWDGVNFRTPDLHVVPTLYIGQVGGVYKRKLFGSSYSDPIEDALDDLRSEGSYAAPNWRGNAEGICIYHTASNQIYKVTLENDEKPKSLAA